MGHGIDGSGARQGPSRARRQALAEQRRCPHCDRKSALLAFRDDLFVGWFRRRCDYTDLRERPPTNAEG